MYADREVTHPPDWHGLVVADVFLNALATGLFLTAALADLAGVGPPPAAYRLALALLAADLVCLVLDLGDPWRFHHMLRVFKPSSPMSLGTWVLSAFSLPLTLLVATDLFGGGFGRSALLVVALPLAFGSAAYKGVLFSTTAQPGWRDARWLGAYHVVSALSLGSALLLAVAVIGGHDAAELTRAATLLLLLAHLLLGLLVTELWPALTRRYGRAALNAGALVGLGCFAVPLVGWLLGWVLIGVAVALAGGLAARYVIVMLPQPHPPPPPSPKRRGGSRKS